MRTIKAIVTVLTLVFSSASFGHGGHTPVSPAEARDIARHVAVKLAEADRGMGFGKLDESWKEIAADKVSITESGPGYYIVAVEHDGEDRTLYVLMSKAGAVYDANFSGEFKNLE